MTLVSEADCLGFAREHPLSTQYDVLRFADKSISFIPRDLRITWVGEPILDGDIVIGRCTGVGFGATVRYNTAGQVLTLGRFTSVGARLRVILGGFHELRSMSTSKVQGYNPRLHFGLEPPDVPLHVRIGSDVWIGDDVTVMAGVQIADGCVIGAGTLLPTGTVTQPYGIYVGNPARLVRHRFAGPVVQALTMLRWWEWEVNILEQVQDLFTVDLTAEADASVALLHRIAAAAEGAPRFACPTWETRNGHAVLS